MNLRNIKNNPKMVRDLSTNAVLASDLSVLRKHEKVKQQAEREERIDKEFNELKTEICAIRDLLFQLIDRKK